MDIDNFLRLFKHIAGTLNTGSLVLNSICKVLDKTNCNSLGTLSTTNKICMQIGYYVMILVIWQRSTINGCAHFSNCSSV